MNAFEFNNLSLFSFFFENVFYIRLLSALKKLFFYGFNSVSKIFGIVFAIFISFDKSWKYKEAFSHNSANLQTKFNSFIVSKSFINKKKFLIKIIYAILESKRSTRTALIKTKVVEKTFYNEKCRCILY